MVVGAGWLVAGSWRRMRTDVSSGGSRRAIYSPRKAKGVIAGKRELVGRAPHGANVEGWVGENGCGRYPTIIEKRLQKAFACADPYPSTRVAANNDHC
jgi:hypothetical protein